MPVPEKRSFNQAYVDARKNQQLEFEWNGKTYDTRLKEESPRQWLNSMYRYKYFQTLADRVHNSNIEARLNALDQFTPVNNFGFSPSKNAYLAQINANLSPEYQLTSADFDNWDPYGIKTKTWETLSNTHFDKLDLSMLSADQKRNWMVTATNKKYPNNPYPLTMERITEWDPDGSKSEALIRGVTLDELHELYGKDWLHYNLAEAFNSDLKKHNPEFSKDFQYDPAKFAKHDPDGRIAAGYMLYGNDIPEGGLLDKVLNDELDLWRQHYENAMVAAENHPTNTGHIPMDELDWTEDGPSYTISMLDPVYKAKASNADLFVARDPLAAKYAKWNDINPGQVVWDNYQDGVKSSVQIPMGLLLGIYGGSAIFKGFPKLDRAVTRNWLKLGNKFFKFYKKTPKLYNSIKQYGLLNGAFDTTFLGGAIYNHAKNPNASWSDLAWGVAPFALMTKPVRTGLSWLGNGVVKGWKNPYIKGTMLTGATVGSGIGLNNLYQNTIKPAMNDYKKTIQSMTNDYWRTIQSSNSAPISNQYLSTYQLPKFNTSTDLKSKIINVK